MKLISKIVVKERDQSELSKNPKNDKKLTQWKVSDRITSIINIKSKKTSFLNP